MQKNDTLNFTYDKIAEKEQELLFIKLISNKFHNVAENHGSGLVVVHRNHSKHLEHLNSSPPS